MLARDRDEAEALEREAALRERLGLPFTRLLPSAARRIEPALAPTLRGALDVPGDHSVDPRRVVAGLRAVPATRCAGRPRGAVGADAVELDGGETSARRSVVVAAGAWSGAWPACRVRPVKGQVVRLRDPAGPGLLTHTLRFSNALRGPTRRRALRDRRDDGGARVRHDGDRGRRL